jgi:tetratricopeptide (TPR) repeat protein
MKLGRDLSWTALRRRPADELSSGRPTATRLSDSCFTHWPALALVALGMACASSQPQITGVTQLPFPSPLSGPGRPQLEDRQWRAVDLGWRSLARGDVADATAQATRAGKGPVADLLRLQIGWAEASAGILQPLIELVATYPEYATAWLTLSVAAEHLDEESIALESAARAAMLWDMPAWQTRQSDLEQRYITDRVEQARARLEHGDIGEALDLAQRALLIEPEHADALLLKGKALYASGEHAQAIEVLSALGDAPDAVYLRARIAELNQDWLSAMELYQSLPVDYDDRGPSMYRVQTRWRLSVLAPYVRQALESEAVTRAELAVAMVALAPEVETLGGGTVPLLSDIVDLPSQREIVTAVRTGLLNADPLEYRFFPDRVARPREIRSAVSLLCALLDLYPPVWCDPEDVVSSSCIDLFGPMSGAELAALLLRLLQQEAQ